ncbi:hypothetical protein GCM10009626_30990 [Brachybacterium sacelli]
MGVNLQAHPDFLLDRVRLVLPRLAGLQVGFVLVLAVIHEAGDRRVRAGCDLDEVEICFRGETQGVLDTDLADLFAGGPDQQDLGDPDLTVDALFADVGSSPWFESDTTKAPASCGGPKVPGAGASVGHCGPTIGHDGPTAILTRLRFARPGSASWLLRGGKGLHLRNDVTRVSTCSSRLS